jgi:hypothetical protein
MGFTRKLLSISTVGLVDYRSEKERSARFARQTRNAARAQVAQQAAVLEHQRQMIAQGNHAAVREEVRDMRAPAVSAPMPGFYHDPQGQPFLRWWDGVQWTATTAPLAPQIGNGA